MQEVRFISDEPKHRQDFQEEHRRCHLVPCYYIQGESRCRQELEGDLLSRKEAQLGDSGHAQLPHPEAKDAQVMRKAECMPAHAFAKAAERSKAKVFCWG